MPHILDPKRLRNEQDYAAARFELADLMRADPDTPGGCRFGELALLIENYEATARRLPGRAAHPPDSHAR